MPMSPVSPRSPVSSRPRSSGFPGSPSAARMQPQGSLPSPRARLGSGELQSPQRQPPPAGGEAQPSKAAILMAIEKADADIEAKHAAVAAVAAKRDQAAAR